MDDDDTEPADSLIAAIARIPPRPLVAEWTPPSVLDEYELMRSIGRGGMGSVWLARDRLLDRLVAIKFIAHLEPDRGTRARFEIEARAAARLQHVNVVTVHRFGEVSGRPYLVSEYIPGDSLAAIAKPMVWRRALEIGIELARGLAAAHREGIIHRDIKPANAIMTADGHAKLVDFGLAKLGAVDAARAGAGGGGGENDVHGATSIPGVVAGTPRYLAPEVRAGAPAMPASDVYQVGAILYELVLGHAPIFDQPTLGADVPSLAPRLDGDADRYASVVDTCLRRDPATRFQSGDELREALEGILAVAPGGELPDGNPYRGLLAYDAEHRAMFFGRGPDVRAVIDRLRAQSFVVVAGDSGVGKSSLCRAGVLPHVSDGAFADGVSWSVVTIVPGRHPLAALAEAMAPRVGMDEATLVHAMESEPVRLARELRRAMRADDGIVVFIDQLEELVTVGDRSEVDAFGSVLGQLVAARRGFRVIASVRSDFLGRVAEIAGIGAELSRAIYLLRPLTAEGARDAIVGPARAKGGRFESSELVDTLVASVATASHTVELPLLAFTLAELWDARDPITNTISARSLEVIGGVRGALAKHADRVIDALLPAQRIAARTMLLRLVSPERTRARRTAADLADLDRAAVDAVVKGRLVVARGRDDVTFELAHERLIDGWPTLATWISETSAARIVHARLAAAVVEWRRVELRRDTLWTERKLAELAVLDGDALTADERRFVDASRRAARRSRYIRRGLVIAVPVVLASIFGGARLVAQRKIAGRIDDRVDDAERSLVTARARDAERATLAAAAYSRFDKGDTTTAQSTWARAREREAEARAAYTEAARSLESAYLLDTDKSAVRRQLADVTFERIVAADRTFSIAERTELVARLSLYDDGELAAKLPRPLRVDPTPPPPGAIVPAGFVYIPSGMALYGSRDDDSIRQWLGTVPMHAVRTGPYLIARTELTYRQWIEFLDALPASERVDHMPGNAPANDKDAFVQLRFVGGTWELQFRKTDTLYVAKLGQPFVYRHRTLRASQNWLDFPVTGISTVDIAAYTAWLDRTARVRHARLCTEQEWERAARGVDGRSYPHGDTLAPDDANIDVTYGQDGPSFGPDAVGSHPVSRSVYGLDDMVGNVWEITSAGHGAYIARGGCYFETARTAHLANRDPIEAKQRDMTTGARICADVD